MTDFRERLALLCDEAKRLALEELNVPEYHEDIGVWGDNLEEIIHIKHGDIRSKRLQCRMKGIQLARNWKTRKSMINQIVKMYGPNSLNVGSTSSYVGCSKYTVNYDCFGMAYTLGSMLSIADCLEGSHPLVLPVELQYPKFKDWLGQRILAFMQEYHAVKQKKELIPQSR